MPRDPPLSGLSGFSVDYYADTGGSPVAPSFNRRVAPVLPPPLPAQAPPVVVPGYSQARSAFAPYGITPPLAYDTPIHAVRPRQGRSPSDTRVRASGPRLVVRQGYNPAELQIPSPQGPAGEHAQHGDPSYNSDPRDREESTRRANLGPYPKPDSRPSSAMPTLADPFLNVQPGIDENSLIGSPLRRSVSDSGNLSLFSRVTSASSVDLLYQYRPIQGTEFRLIRLLPATMVVLKCEIIHASLESPPKYTAISYAWGDLDSTVKIYLDGSPFRITTSLHGALKAIRRDGESVLIWADYLCINQHDREEQSRQVKLMANIYSEAELVAVWLGPQTKDSDSAFSLIDLLVNNADSATAFSALTSSKIWRPNFTALVQLFEREYWSRLWVVQEILNARAIDVFCGNKIIPWSKLTRIAATLESHAEELARSFPVGSMRGNSQRTSYANVLCRQGPASIEVLKPLRSIEVGALLEVLHACRSKLASDPKDKVFGVYGIMTDEIRYHFNPDYGKSLREIYTDVVDYLLHTTRRVEVICHAIHFPPYTSTTGNIPTWVPEWSHVPQISALSSSFKYSAAEDTRARFNFVDEQRTKIQISAIYLDTVVS